MTKNYFRRLTTAVTLITILFSASAPAATTVAQGVPVEPTSTPQPLPTMPAQVIEGAATPTPEAQPTATTTSVPEFVPGVVLVGVPATAARGGAGPIESLAALVGGTPERLFTTASDGVAARGATSVETDVFRMSLPAGADVLAAAAALQQNGASWAEPDYVARAIPVQGVESQSRESEWSSASSTSNDPLLAQQWGLTKINAAAAWNVVTGTPATVIAFIDSGIDRSHPDLAARLWVNPGEVAGNGIDDDNNGYIDDVNGWNFVGKNNNVGDDNGHGTQVAGVAAAAGNNGVGVAGVCWNCRIMVVKAMQSGGTANYSDVAAAVNYAVAKGARVINLSLGGYADSNVLRTAIQNAAGSAVVVAGAGNDNSSNRFYPAAYANVLAIAATNSANAREGFSNYGDWVSLAAPGVAITTTFSGGDYGAATGTSLSTSFVAGLAGLIRSQRSSWSPALVRQQLLQTAKSLTASGLGRGLPDGAKAVLDPQPLLVLAGYTVNGEVGGRPAAGSTVELVVNVANAWLDATNVRATLSTNSPYATVGTGSVQIGVLTSGETKVSSALSFTIRSDAGYARDIPFTLRLMADEGGYARNVPITVTTRSSEEPVCGTILNEDDLSQIELLWTSDKTYVATCDINVPAGYTLTIQPGTHVQFTGNYTFTVNGTLIADGTEAERIVFAAATAQKLWSGLHFTSSAADSIITQNGIYRGGSVLRHLILQNATHGIRCEAVTLLIVSVLSNIGGVQCITGQGKPSTTISSDNNPLEIRHTASTFSTNGGDTCMGDTEGWITCWRFDYVYSGMFLDYQIFNVGAPVIQISMGSIHACVITNEHKVKCWGDNQSGQLGNGTTQNARTPLNAVILEADALKIALGTFHTCALLANGKVFCWGSDGYGQIGNDSQTAAFYTVPQRVSLSEEVIDLAAGGSHTCAVTRRGAVMCWGDNWNGQLGNGESKHSTSPTLVANMPSQASSVAAGEAHSCAAIQSGGVMCWGLYWGRHLSEPVEDTRTDSRIPVAIEGISGAVASIASGGSHTCAMLDNQELRCWGMRGSGQIGSPISPQPGKIARQVVGLGQGFVAMSLGSGMACTLTNRGGIKCWGAIAGNLPSAIPFSVDPSWITWIHDSYFNGNITIVGPAVISNTVTSGSVEANGIVDIFTSTMNGFVLGAKSRVINSSSLASGTVRYGSAIIQHSQITGSVSVGNYSRVEGNRIFLGAVNAGENVIVANNTLLWDQEKKNSPTTQGNILVGSNATVIKNYVYGGGITTGNTVSVTDNRVISGGIIVGKDVAVHGNAITASPGPALDALVAAANVTVVGNRFVDSAAGIVASSGFFSGNLIANNAGDGIQFGAATVISNTIVGNGGVAMRVQGGAPLQIAGNNLEGNKGSFDLYLDVPSGINVAATNNWWGVTSTAAIRGRVFDWRRDSTKALAVFSPTLPGPVLDAPAYVRRVVASPDTVGIESVAFSVEFSKDMLPEPLPLLAVAGPGYAETITGTWTTSTTASFATEVTALWTRGRYTTTVSSAVGVDGIEIASHSDYSFTVDYAGSVTDQSPPSTPHVTIQYDGSLTQLTLRWVTTDTESGITAYRYAVGTTLGGTDVVNWTTINAPAGKGLASEFTVVRSGLNLVRGQTYYVSAQARNAGGLWSESGVSSPTVGGEIPTATPIVTPTQPPSGTPGPLTFVVFVPAAWR